MIDNNIVVAVQAFFHCRYAGMIGIGDIRVTVLTLDLFDAAMDIVAEGDGLLRSNRALRQLVKYKNKCPNDQPGD